MTVTNKGDRWYILSGNTMYRSLFLTPSLSLNPCHSKSSSLVYVSCLCECNLKQITVRYGYWNYYILFTMRQFAVIFISTLHLGYEPGSLFCNAHLLTHPLCTYWVYDNKHMHALLRNLLFYPLYSHDTFLIGPLLIMAALVV